MSEKTRVLITGSGGAGTLGRELVKAFLMTDNEYEIIATNSNPIDLYINNEVKMLQIPNATSPDYIEKLLEICKNLNASEYLSGELGINYLKKEIFDDANIKVIFERFEHPTYNQIHGKFIPNMSIIDLLFNEGGKAKKILEKSQNY